MDVGEIRRAMVRKLEALEDRRKDHIWFYFSYDGKEYKGPKLSHSWHGDLNDQQIAWLKKPLELTKSEFQDFVECPLSTQEFYEKWTERKGLPSPSSKNPD